MNEGKLIERCLDKDKEAWDLFVDKYSRLIYWAIIKRAASAGFKLSQDDIDSIFQDVFVAILETEKLRGLKNSKALAGWLVIAAANKTIDHVRRMVRDREILIPARPDLGAVNGMSKVFSNDLEDVINGIIESLPPREKIVISLNILKGRTHKEIAGILNIPVNTVSTIISRTKERLKKELFKKGIKDF